MTASSFTIPDGRRASLSIKSPLTYRLRGDHSFFNDLLLAKRDDDGARERMARHEREMRGELPKIEHRSSRTTLEEVTYEFRAPNATLGQGGYGTPPAWMVQLEGTAPRPERVVADLIDPMPLPDGVSSVNVPQINAGTTTQQALPNAANVDTDVTDTAASSPVVQISGQSDIPMQMLEQSPRGAWEEVLLRDLQADYDAKLEKMLLTGTGGSGPTGQILGLLNVSGITSVSYTSGSPSATGLFPVFGQAFGAIADNRKIRPEGWLMRGGRFAWLATSEDQQSRPLEVPLSAHSLILDPTKPSPIASLVNLPVFTDEQLPSSQGAGANQDVIIAFRWSDVLAWEGSPRISINTQVLSGTMQARVVYRRYAAALFARYPSAIATIGGTGLVVPANE